MILILKINISITAATTFSPVVTLTPWWPNRPKPSFAVVVRNARVQAKRSGLVCRHTGDYFKNKLTEVCWLAKISTDLSQTNFKICMILHVYIEGRELHDKK
jgi:hypothetical protein